MMIIILIYPFDYQSNNDYIHNIEVCKCIRHYDLNYILIHKRGDRSDGFTTSYGLHSILALTCVVGITHV